MDPTVQPRLLPGFFSEPGTTTGNAIGVKATEIAAGNFNGAYQPLTRRCSSFKIEPFRPVGGIILSYNKQFPLTAAPRAQLPITSIFREVALSLATFLTFLDSI